MRKENAQSHEIWETQARDCGCHFHHIWLVADIWAINPALNKVQSSDKLLFHQHISCYGFVLNQASLKSF